MKYRIRDFLLISVIIAAGILSGCGRSKKEVHLILKTPPLTVGTDENAEIREVYDLLEKAGNEFAAQYEDADVTVDVVKFNYVDEAQYITDCFDTDKAVDVLFEGYFNMFSYIYTGRPVPLDDVISEEAFKDLSFEDLTMSKVNGKTYMLPYYNLQNTMVYNKNMFRQCGLDQYIADEGIITNWSLKDWNIILDTLAEKLPAMHYPMMMYAKNNQGDTHIMTLLRSHGCPLFDENNDFCLNTPEGIAALKWLRNGVDKGWYPPGSENLEISDCTELFLNDQLAICMTNNASYPAYEEGSAGLVNFPGIGEQGLSTSFITGFMVFDNGDEAKLKAAKEFLRYFYSREEYLRYETVGIPANQSVAEAAKQNDAMLDAYMANRVTQVDFTGNNPNWQGTDTSVRNVFWPHIASLLSGDVTPEACARDIDRDCNAAIQSGRDAGRLHD